METEYASKSQGNTATTLGAIGTGLGILNMHGGLGGLFGGGMAANAANAAALAVNSEKDAKIARLEAEKYADKNTVEVYNALAKADKEINGKVDDLKGRVLAIETAAPLREKILEQKIDGVALTAANGIRSLNDIVGRVTKIVVPNSSICPGWGPVTVEPTPATP